MWRCEPLRHDPLKPKLADSGRTFWLHREGIQYVDHTDSGVWSSHFRSKAPAATRRCRYLNVDIYCGVIEGVSNDFWGVKAIVQRPERTCRLHCDYQLELWEICR